ncbi:MAG TPA: hypothetical protein VGM17_05795 [Rhizomicrobium sp.]|jgi:hypothetical protein
MSLVDSKQRLDRLIELASQEGLPARRALVGEIADLLLDWPDNYPAGMREPFEALFTRAIRDVDADTRHLMAGRLAHSEKAPLSILHGLLPDAPVAARAAIVSHYANVTDGAIRIGVNEATLLPAARTATEAELAQVLTSRFRIPDEIAARVVGDKSAFLLAVLCKGTRVSRATFSALALSAAPHASAEESYRRLSAYDDVPEDGARGLLAYWRSLVATARAQAA